MHDTRVGRDGSEDTYSYILKATGWLPMTTPPIPVMIGFSIQIHQEGEQSFPILLREILRGEIKGLSKASF